MRMGIPLDVISSTSSTPPISITTTNMTPAGNTYNHCTYSLRMSSRRPSNSRMHCTAVVCRHQVSATPLFIFIPSASCTSSPTNSLFLPLGPLPTYGCHSCASELPGLDDVCSGWDGVLSLAARDRTRRRDLRQLHTCLGRCVCRLCTDAYCCVNRSIDEIPSVHRIFWAVFLFASDNGH